jgi:hypothetical protein
MRLERARRRLAISLGSLPLWSPLRAGRLDRQRSVLPGPDNQPCIRVSMTGSIPLGENEGVTDRLPGGRQAQDDGPARGDQMAGYLAAWRLTKYALVQYMPDVRRAKSA